MPIDDFEVLREPDRVLFRTMLQQPSSERYAILQNLGFTRQELRHAEQEADMIRESRCQSYLDIDVDDGNGNGNGNTDADTDTYKKEQYQLRLQKLYEVSQLRKQQQRHRHRRLRPVPSQKQSSATLVTSSSSSSSSSSSRPPISPMLSSMMRRIMIFK
jgi:predicted secreted protein